MLGNKKRDIVGQHGTFLHRLFQQNRYPHFQLRRLNSHRQPRIKTRNQPVIHASDFFRIGIAGNDNLFFGRDQRLEGIEKLFLGAAFPTKKLNIVNEQQIERMIVALEIIKALALIRRDHVSYILLGVDIPNFDGRIICQHLIADRMNQMRLAEPNATI